MSTASNFFGTGGSSGPPITGAMSGTVLIPSGTSADVVIPCPADKRLVLTSLVANPSIQPGVTLKMGTRTAFSNKSIEWLNGYSQSNAGAIKIGGTRNNYNEVAGGVGESLTLSFASSTTQDLYYSYYEGS